MPAAQTGKSHTKKRSHTLHQIHFLGVVKMREEVLRSRMGRGGFTAAVGKDQQARPNPQPKNLRSSWATCCSSASSSLLNERTQMVEIPNRARVASTKLGLRKGGLMGFQSSHLSSSLSVPQDPDCLKLTTKHHHHAKNVGLFLLVVLDFASVRHWR